MLDPGQPQTLRYSAFISYCRRDSRDAQWLQAALERYRVPARLVGQPTPAGPVPERFRPVFLDQSELAAATDLAAELSQALAASEFLIVLCTPRAAASDWVNREIRTMQDAGRGSHILAALFDGDERTAFPPALQQRDQAEVVPLAADFRKEGDGRRLALLKLVAVMAGVGLGDLVHREEGRRNRRLTGVAASAAAGMAAFAALSIYALDAKAEAEAERRKSEQLIETLVTDLRTAVKPLGSLAVLAKINDAAVRYFRGQSLEDMPDEALAQRARLLTAMGEDAAARGALGEALVHLQEAERTTATRLAAAPEDPKRIFDHSQVEFWLGYHAWRAGDPAAARTAWNDYRDYTLKLLAMDPTSTEWQLEAAYAETNLGTLELRQSLNVVAAEERFTRALSYFRALHRQDPSNSKLVLEVSNGLGWLADTQRASGQLEAARQSRGDQLALLTEAIRAEPQNVALQRQLLSNRIASGRIADEAGELDVAVAQFAQARREATDLLRSDPADAALAMSQQMASLFEVRARLRMARGSGASVNAAAAGPIGPCEPGRTTADLWEVVDWCHLVTARQAIVEQRAASVSETLAAVKRRQTAPSKPRLSAEFGIDFQKEVEQLEVLARSGGKSG